MSVPWLCGFIVFRTRTGMLCIIAGRMGKEIEKLAKEKGVNILSIICPEKKNQINEKTLQNVDVCIDFSAPDAVVENIKKIAALKKNIVVGTTGWYDHMDQVKKIVEETGIGLIWSGNYAIGVNALFNMVEHAAHLFNNIPAYDVMVTEYHHRNKADSPSGTAIMIGNLLTKHIERKSKLVEEKLDRKIKPDEIHVASVRGGSIPGTHSILFDSDGDSIELSITVRNREGYATGALMAAEFIKDKTGFFEINDLMKDIIGG